MYRGHRTEASRVPAVSGIAACLGIDSSAHCCEAAGARAVFVEPNVEGGGGGGECKSKEGTDGRVTHG